MKLILPAKQNCEEQIHVETKNLVVIGTNGAGKSSFGRDLQRRYPDVTEYISGLHALFISNEESEPTKVTELTQLSALVNERIFMPRLSEYEKLILKLKGEEFEAAVNFKENCKEHPGQKPPITKIDIIQKIWEKMFPHNHLLRKSGFIELVSVEKDANSYKANRMSDSEKLVLYLIGAVLCARQDAVLVIEEPETLLHDSIKNQLWDEIEAMRPDCSFIYLTHDIDFASARHECERVWIRSYDGDRHLWNYEIIRPNESFPEELYMEILGSRKPILFIEGTDTNSIDIRLYPFIFPDYTVKPMGGCQKVIETTKAFTQLQAFHSLESMGIVDRDRRTEGEIEYLRSQHILVPNVAEVENLLLIEEVIRTVAQRMMKNPDDVFAEVKEHVIHLFAKDLESQVLLHARHQVRKKLEMSVDHKIASEEELAEHVDNISKNIHVDEIYSALKSEFTSYIETNDYASILRVYNQKGTLPQSRLCGLLGINNKESYLNLILSILRENRKDAAAIRTAIKKSLGVS